MPVDTIARDRFTALGVKTNAVDKVFHDKTIKKSLFFVIDVPPDIFESLFIDLEFAVQKANLYARKKYKIKKLGIAPTNCFDAFDGEKTYARIFPLQSVRGNGEYIYYIDGYYQSLFRIRGNMILDIKFESQGSNTFFYINSYISIADPFLRDLAQFMMSSAKFRKDMDRIIESTINEVRRVGFLTARTLQRMRTDPPKPEPQR